MARFLLILDVFYKKRKCLLGKFFLKKSETEIRELLSGFVIAVKIN
jgi:hypothetical protein